MRTQNQKLKLLFLMDVLLSRTDENHPMTADVLVKTLEEQGISAERKAVYRDIAALQEYGVDIIKSPKKGFFVGSRDFDLAELKLLADAVASAKFITEKKSKALIGKLGKLTSSHHARQLKRQVHYLDRVKSSNEQIFYNTDAIHEAIDLKRQIGFIYYEYGLDKVLIPKRNGERYQVSPYLLLWEDENYYLIAYHPRYDALAHFRVDKMRHIEMLPEKAQSFPEKINPADYAKRTFSMFGGEEMPITLMFRPGLIGVFIDRFGKDITLTQADEWLKTRVHVRVSPSFFAWVFQLQDGVKLMGPSKIVDEYMEYLKKITNLYI
jgi:predicted DNA-binding transcriptional regulator YafY